MPLPPSPEDFRQSVPPVMVSSVSAFTAAHEVVSLPSSVVSIMGLPVVMTVVRPPFTSMTPPQLMPFTPWAVAMTLSTPPSM